MFVTGNTMIEGLVLKPNKNMGFCQIIHVDKDEKSCLLLTDFGNIFKISFDGMITEWLEIADWQFWDGVVMVEQNAIRDRFLRQKELLLKAEVKLTELGVL